MRRTANSRSRLTKLQTIQREGASQLVDRTMQRLIDPHFGGEM